MLKIESFRRPFALAAAAGTTMFLVSHAGAQEVVYSNIGAPQGTLIGQVASGATTGYEAGDQVTLAGAGRTITQFQVNPYNLGAAVAGTVQIRFYNYPGFAGSTNPGTSGAVLWDSGPVAANFIAGQNAITLPVNNIVVPNEFTWTAQYTTNTAATGALGNRVNDPPTIGSSGNFFWANNSPGFPGWANLVFQPPPTPPPVANFGAVITAQTVVVNGACCKTDGTCSVITNAACAAFPGAVFQGTGTTCTPNNCPQPGACCQAAGVCSSLTQAACVNQGGVWGGTGTTCPPTPPCSQAYFYDDGLGENAIGFNAGSASIAWMNRFTVTNGLNNVVSIDIAFGNTGAGAAPATLNGLPVDVYLWSDPNADGSPADAVVLSTVSGVVANGNTDTFNTFTLSSPVNVGPNGTNFFVGAILTATLTSGTGVFPARIDQSHSQGKSWISGNANNTPVNPNTLATSGTGVAVIDTFGLAGNWMVRANATAAVACYANCDNSTQPPVLNVGDFTCFLQKYAASDPYANCDNSTQPPVLNVGDFTCFLQKYAAGCT